MSAVRHWAFYLVTLPAMLAIIAIFSAVVLTLGFISDLFLAASLVFARVMRYATSAGDVLSSWYGRRVP